jgi:hypothetical protein
MISLFLIVQTTLFFCMLLHDWVDLFPFTDLKALKKAHSFRFRLVGSILNGILVLIPLLITFHYGSAAWPLSSQLITVGIYGLITWGTLTAWWIPYLTGHYLWQGNKAGFEEYRNTHSFLPPYKDHVVPNTLHAILHLQVWSCFGFALWNLFA